MPSLRCNGVKLIEEEYTWLRSLGPIKQIPDTLFRGTDILVQNFRTLDTDEIEATLACNSAGKKRLTATGISVKKKARSKA